MSREAPPVWTSLLYVPAHRRRLLEGAHRRDADAIILDLEDGVPEASKEEARANLAWAVPHVSQAGAASLVRTNRPWRYAWRDIEAAVAAGASGLLLPKVESAGQVQTVAQYLEELEREYERMPLVLIAIIESAAGLLEVDRIASATPRLLALVPGNEDLALSLRIDPTPERMAPVIGSLLVTARAHELALFGTVGSGADYRNLEAYRERVQATQGFGFDGTTCIHPDQVQVVNEVYRPTAETLAQAREVVATFEAAGGEAVGHGGRMIDQPVYLRAKRLVARSEGRGS